MRRVITVRSRVAPVDELAREKAEAVRSALNSCESRQAVMEAWQKAEKRMAWAASEKRLGKEIRAYAKLDKINERWKLAQREGGGG